MSQVRKRDLGAGFAAIRFGPHDGLRVQPTEDPGELKNAVDLLAAHDLASDSVHASGDVRGRNAIPVDRHGPCWLACRATSSKSVPPRSGPC